MKSGYFQRWLFFISSYFPLYLLLTVGKLNYSKSICNQIRHNCIYFLVLAFFIILSIVQVISLIKGNGSEEARLPSEMTISPESESLMNYVITYITPILSLKIDDLNSVITNGVLFLIIGLIYTGSSAAFLKPLLGMIGYRIFGVNNYPGAHHLISRLSFDELEKARNNQDKVILLRIGEGVYTVTNENKGIKVKLRTIIKSLYGKRKN